ncbi:hypothetical protein GGI15_001599 [Coemansia interrupta]|uniref:Beta-galactosidase n=1 Tax=Coemansia interrupta TaxID=1126814 RepID=A0A9W8HP15_9FUNG|nr:hypothetical protein GGI15_001599 [Coemansia interrupta]
MLKLVTSALAVLAAVGVLGAIEKQIPGDPYTVGYSARGLLIDGEPRVLTAGAIHYPRSTPEMWDPMMKKAKRGGLNTIDTYVFWNMHERTKGEYDFATDRANLPLFIETARRNGLFVMLRIGPYVCAEWNYGGFPQWLRHEKDIVYRTNSKPFKREMKRFIAKVIDVVKPYMPENGGPIIGMQIENEYGDHQRNFGHDGDLYADWCGETAASFNVSVPWIMCRQYYKVEGVIPTQNDFYCDQYLGNHHRKYPEFPDMWTEMWPGWFQRWGEAAPHRPIEDIAYAVAKWYAYGGTYVAYYMYQGGTNFGRTSGPFIMTSYDYDGFIDEYGLENWPKYLHLAELHKHLLDNADYITGNPVPRAQQLVKGNNEVLAHVYGEPNVDYLAFLVNANPKKNATVRFDGAPLELHRWSVTLVRRQAGELKPTVLYNSAHLSHAVRQALESPAGFKRISSHAKLLKTQTISWRNVVPPVPDDMTIESDHPLEQIDVTDDRTDYLWYRTRVKVPTSCLTKSERKLVLEDAGDVAFVYFDEKFSAMRHGRQDQLATFTFDLPDKIAKNTGEAVDIAILSQTMGMAHNQQHMEAYGRGLLGSVLLCGHNITQGQWLMRPGLEDVDDGDDAAVADFESKSVTWHPYAARSHEQKTLRWYAIELDVQALIDDEKKQGLLDDPENYPRYAIDMASMTKGQLWINGHHLGRYWLRRAPEKKDYKPCQWCGYGGWFWPDNRYYHLPRSYLRLPSEANPQVRNFLYVLEELEGDAEEISVARRISTQPRGHEDRPIHGSRPTLWSLFVHVCAFAALAGAAGLAVAVYRRYKATQGYEVIGEQNTTTAASNEDADNNERSRDGTTE